MKFSIMRSKLLEGLQKVQNVVSSKPGNLVILQNAHFEAEDNRLCITTTDLDITERCHIECEVLESGSTTLPIKFFTNIVREIEDGKSVIEIDENDVANVQSGSSYFKINGMAARYFPPVSSPEGSYCFTINQGVLREMFRKTNYAVVLDETRRMLNGVLMSFKENKLTVVATDSRRLALVEHEVEFAPEAETELILPIKAVNELLRIMGHDGDIKIYTQKNMAVFEFDNTMLSSKLIDGIYPNYRQVLPSKCDERIVIDRETLLSAMRRMAVMATDKSNAVRLTFSANQLIISINTPDVGEARDTVPIKYAGKEISIIFNPSYIMDPLRNIDDDEIFFELNDGTSPALIKCSVPFLYVLMPLRMS